MRSERNCGIGDFSDLATLGEILASEGADFVGVSPLHALFSAAPRRFSPYSPSSRRFLNPLYISIDSIETEPHTPPAGTNDLRRADLVDYAGVAAIKRAELEAMFQRFRSNHYLSGSAADNAFERYRRRRGSSLRDFARFEAISEMAVATSGEEAAAGGWQRPNSPRSKTASRPPA
jgi:4-alpha-glucanotransferase